MKYSEIRNEEDWQCPKCGDMLRVNVDIGDEFFQHDICLGCGFKRKKKVDDRAEVQIQKGA